LLFRGESQLIYKLEKKEGGFWIQLVQYGMPERFLLWMKTPIITPPRMITAAINERYSPIATSAGVWLGVGEGVVAGVEVGAGVPRELDVEVGVGDGVDIGEGVGVGSVAGIGEGVDVGDGVGVGEGVGVGIDEDG
jgi:hypothetical protein